jgi:hypothetical protein
VHEGRLGADDRGVRRERARLRIQLVSHSKDFIKDIKIIQ